LNNKWFLRISLTTSSLALFDIVLGAYLRFTGTISDCYGCITQTVPTDKAREIMQVADLYPHLEIHSLLLINNSFNSGSAISSPNDTNKVIS